VQTAGRGRRWDHRNGFHSYSSQVDYEETQVTFLIFVASSKYIFMSDVRERLLEMHLHDDIEISKSLNVVRVPGGWIYKFFNETEDDQPPTFQSAVFVANLNDSFYKG
jgi:hypothetical protein